MSTPAPRARPSASGATTTSLASASTQAPAAICRDCPLRARCTESAEGRKLNRQFDEAYRERARRYRDTPAYTKALRKRQVWVEPLFGEAKEWHGLRRFRLRGLDKVNIEGVLVAAGQNLKRLLARLGWGRRPWPSGAPGLRLGALTSAPAA